MAVFKIIEKYSVGKSMGIFGLTTFRWTTSFHKSYKNFFKIFNMVKYSGDKRAIVSMVKKQMGLYKDKPE